MKTVNNFSFSFLKFASFLLLIPLTFVACESDDDDGPDNPEELITTVILNFTDGNGVVSSFAAADPAGDGLTPDEIDEVVLTANTTYELTVEFLDESDPNDVEDITEEVEEEDDEHLVCYTSTGAMPNVTITDKDGNGDDLGLTAESATAGAGTGTFRVVLKHEPTKGIADACSTGETDVEVTFNVVVQ
jgi:hypothetical protein